MDSDLDGGNFLLNNGCGQVRQPFEQFFILITFGQTMMVLVLNNGVWRMGYTFEPNLNFIK